MAKVDLTAPVAPLVVAEKVRPDLEPEAHQIERYGLLEQAMIQAEADHIVTPLPESKPESVHAYSTSRFNVLVNRLYMLGYLQNDAVPDQLDETYQQAVKAFQQDALGESLLTPDGWVGEKTWAALQEMVSFEEPSNLNQWCDHHAPCKALRRAAVLRLYALGLSSRAPGHLKRGSDLQSRIDKLLTKALSGFSDVARLLGWEEAETLHAARLQTLELLFDQDEIVARLATVRIPRPLQARKAIKPFIVGMVRIELWLIGYAISPKGYAGASDLMTYQNGLDLKDSSVLYKQLVHYWGEYEQNAPELFQNLSIHYPKLQSQGKENRSKGLIRIGFPEFFGSLLQRNRSASQENISDSELVYQHLREAAGKTDQEGSLIQEIWNHVYSIGARIWDGIKRVCHWVIGLVKKALVGIKQLIKHISRIAYQFILKAYEQTRLLIKGVTGSIHYFLRSPLEMPALKGVATSPRLLFIHDRDFDFRAFVESTEQPNAVRLHSRYLENNADIFGLSCHLVGECLHHLLNMLKDIWATTWAGLLMALLKTYKSIQRWGPDIMALEQQQLDMQVADAVVPAA